MRATDVAVLAARRDAPRAGGPGVVRARRRRRRRATASRSSACPVAGIGGRASGSCAAARARPGATVRLIECEWLWDAAIANDCAGILGGSSGSPMFAAGDRHRRRRHHQHDDDRRRPGRLVLPRPAVRGHGRRRHRGPRPQLRHAASAAWAACWAPSFDIANDGCPAEQPPVVTVDAPLRAVPPGATWAATIANGGPDRPTVVKTGPASTTDCRDPAGYGEPGADTPRTVRRAAARGRGRVRAVRGAHRCRRRARRRRTPATPWCRSSPRCPTHRSRLA